MLSAPLLEAVGISKAFPGVQALSNVSLSLGPGEVLGVVGENGAGKSTLMKILGGVQAPDTGVIRLDGREITLPSVYAAQQLGVVLIHQELNLADTLDVAGNLFLGREPRWGGPLGLIHPRIYADAEVLTQRLGLECSGRTLVSDLSVGQQQLVEIARALSLRSRVLIMDEPTSSLTQRETDRLFTVIRDLKRDGVSILYISHRMPELTAICDRITVLRDGANAGELAKNEITHDAMVRLMVGRELKKFFHRGEGSGEGEASGQPAAAASEHSGKPPILKVSGLRYNPKLTSTISFELRPGEIVGVAGLMGAGRTELAETIFGVRPALAGSVTIDGRPLRLGSPQAAIDAGIYLAPEDRRVQGLVLAESIKRNISLPSLRTLSMLRLVARSREQATADQMCRELGVRTPGIEQRVGLLSGGNQQKVVLAKWLCKTPRVLILDEPTRGIDVGAKSEIYALMQKLADQGIAVLMISSDLEEVLGVSQRILVMHEGHLAGELPAATATQESIMQLATGGSVSQ